MSQDYDLGMLTLTANAHWKAARLRLKIEAWLFGEHKVYVHLGKRMRVSFLRGRPYLLSISGNW